MSLLIQYLVKLSLSLGVVWLFYFLVLRKLTFYNSNRWYLLGYTLLSFCIPFINVTPLFENKQNEIIQLVPSVHRYTVALEEASHCPTPLWSTQFDKWDLIAFGLMTGAGLLLLRFVARYLSFLKVRRKARLISDDEVRIYRVDQPIIPFSFGNSIFINPELHTEAELEEIVRHEFVHVKQKHTLDIIWAEILCIMNWYNPFAWWLKKSIRQNLEFIADDNVIRHGHDKKQYQYLLLKVIGNNQFSIATQFNFSSLKKRIAMMNKTKSTKRQLGRFLFLVPVVAIILLSFRHSFKESAAGKTGNPTFVTDTIPDITVTNSKGYFIDIKDDNGNCLVVVKDKNKKEAARLLLTEWNAKNDYYEGLYGEILSPSTSVIEETIRSRHPDITTVKIRDNVATVILRNGKTETYTLSVKEQKKAFEERWGVTEAAIAATVDETAAPNVVNPVNEVTVVRSTIADDFEINDKKAVMKLRDGTIEEFDLTDPKQKTAFENKFGKIIKPSLSTTGVYSVVSVAAPSEQSVSTTVSVMPANEVAVISQAGDVMTTDGEKIIPVEAEVLLTITRTTTKEELERFKKKLKEKGIEVSYDDIEFRDGALVRISGSVKSENAEANFVGVDFNKIVISQVRDGEKIFLRIDELVKKKRLS